MYVTSWRYARLWRYVTLWCHDVIKINDSYCSSGQFLKTGRVEYIGVLQTPTRATVICPKINGFFGTGWSCWFSLGSFPVAATDLHYWCKGILFSLWMCFFYHSSESFSSYRASSVESGQGHSSFKYPIK